MDAEQDLETERHGNEVCLNRNLFGFKADLSMKEKIFKMSQKHGYFGAQRTRHS